MNGRPRRGLRNVSGGTYPRLECAAAILVVLGLLAGDAASATAPPRPPAAPQMPDPCTTAPVLPFCR